MVLYSGNPSVTFFLLPNRMKTKAGNQIKMQNKLIIFSAVQNRNMKRLSWLNWFVLFFVIFVFWCKTKHILKQKITVNTRKSEFDTFLFYLFFFSKFILSRLFFLLLWLIAIYWQKISKQPSENIHCDSTLCCLNIKRTIARHQQTVRILNKWNIANNKIKSSAYLCNAYKLYPGTNPKWHFSLN